MATEQDVTKLQVYSDPSVIEGKALILHNPQTGDAVAFDATKLGKVEYQDLSMYTIYGGSLLKRETANCYVISKPGAYKFPLVYGNAIKNGVANTPAYTNQGGANQRDFVNHRDAKITSPYIEQNASCAVHSAAIVWQDEQDLITGLKVVDGGDCKYIHFLVEKMPQLNANAILCVKDSSGNIMWSWHIWCCADDLSPVAVENYTGVKYELMPLNLGWKWDSTDRLRGKNPHYQWGRKDPMPCAKTYNSTSIITLYGSHTNYGADEAATSIGLSIKNPQRFFKQDGETYYNWFTGGSKYNLWNAAINSVGANDDQDTAIKTIYDPCPVGFMIPAGRAFTGFTKTGQYVETPLENANVIGSWNAGWTFKKDDNDTVGIFFPASGYRERAAGSLAGMGSSGYAWSFAAYSAAYAYYLGFSSGYVGPLSYSYRAGGFPVRPCRESD